MQENNTIYVRRDMSENTLVARSWLYQAKRDLETADLLWDAEHYCDIVGTNLHAALSKIFNAILVYHEHDFIHIGYYIIEICL